MNDLRIPIIEQLRPTANKLVRRALKRYENSVYSYCFNQAELTAMAEDLMIIVAERRLSSQVDEKGIYNYFTECFNHKCQDLYHAHAKTQKRGSIDIDPKDLSECNLQDGSIESSPEVLLSRKQEFNSIVNFLKQFDKPKSPFSRIIHLFLEGKNSLEIQNELQITASSLDRYKQQGIELLKGYPKADHGIEIHGDDKISIFLIPKREETIVKSHIFREIKFTPKKDFEAKFSYYCSVEVYKENKLLKKDKILLKQEDSTSKENFFFLQKTDLKQVELEFKDLIEVKENELKAA